MLTKTKLSPEIIELGILSARMSKEPMQKIMKSIETKLDAGWKGSVQELADQIKADYEAVRLCIKGYAANHRNWDRSNVK